MFSQSFLLGSFCFLASTHTFYNQNMNLWQVFSNILLRNVYVYAV